MHWRRDHISTGPLKYLLPAAPAVLDTTLLQSHSCSAPSSCPMRRGLGALRNVSLGALKVCVILTPLYKSWVDDIHWHCVPRDKYIYTLLNPMKIPVSTNLNIAIHLYMTLVCVFKSRQCTWFVQHILTFVLKH